LVGALVIALSLLGGWLEILDAAPQACLDADRVEQRVGAALAQAPSGPEPRARVVVDRGDDRLTARVQLIDARGAAAGIREIIAPASGCRQLEDAVVLHLTLALEESTTVAPAPAAPAPIVPGPNPIDGAPAVRALAPASAAPGSALVRSWLGAGTIAGALPGVGFGPALGLRGRWQRWSLSSEARVDWAFPTDHDGFRIRSWRPALGGDACLHPGALGLCTGLRGGLLRASSGRSSTSPTLDVTGRLVVSVMPAVALYAEPAMALVRTRLYVDGRPSWITPRASLAAGVMVRR
jgi:hypothetical protein